MTPTTNTGGRATGRSALVALGVELVTKRLESVGCAIEAPARRGGTFEVRTPSDRTLRMYISTQHLGGYVFWPKRRFAPSADLLAAIVLIGGLAEPDVYLIPSSTWLDAKPPFTDRDNIGKRSEPEYGASVARSALPALEPFLWNDSGVKRGLLK